tara:strand:+ start:10869 stop:11819 length:951 start_codon:yes stop_codon:yes gene_type:complete
MNGRVLVTGGSGLVGKAIETIVQNNNLYNDYDFKFLSSKTCDLTNLEETRNLFDKYKPDYVIHLAAYVGGLFKNLNNKVAMYEINTLINTNVIKCCHEFKVKKCISCLSTCIFPDKTTYPITEKMLHDGPPHDSNFSYAYSKRMLQIQSRAYCEQYGSKFYSVIPTNIYGPHDNFSLEDAHVIPALIHKCYLAKLNNEKFVVKGSGKPLRQFIFSHDLAKLMMWTLFNYEDNEPIILSVSEEKEVSIKQVAEYIAKHMNYESSLTFDESFSDGQYKKTADNSKLQKLYGEFQFTEISDGIKKSIDWFIENFDVARK